MEIEDLKLFVDVARRGGFAPVARVRDVDPSAISRAVAALEDEVGVRLFQRTTRKVTLTNSGEVFFARVSVIVDELDAACDDARSTATGPKGILRMTASNAFGPMCIAPVLREFRTLYPEISIELVLSDEQLDLVAERIDLAVRLGPADDRTRAGVKLFDTRYRVCVSPSYQRHAGILKTPTALRTHRCLLFPFENFRTRWLFQREAEDAKETVLVDGDLVTASALTLRACALDGMGPALLPNWLVDEDIKKGLLIDVFPRYRVTATSYETAVWIVYPSRSHLPAKVKAMTHFLRLKLGSLAKQV